MRLLLLLEVLLLLLVHLVALVVLLLDRDARRRLGHARRAVPERDVVVLLAARLLRRRAVHRRTGSRLGRGSGADRRSVRPVDLGEGGPRRRGGRRARARVRARVVGVLVVVGLEGRRGGSWRLVGEDVHDGRRELLVLWLLLTRRHPGDGGALLRLLLLALRLVAVHAHA